MFNNLMTGTNKVLGVKSEIDLVGFEVGSSAISKAFIPKELGESCEGWAIRLASLKVNIKGVNQIKFISTPASDLPYPSMIPFILHVQTGSSSSSIILDKWIIQEGFSVNGFIDEWFDDEFNLNTQNYIQIDYYTPCYGSSGSSDWVNYVASKLTSTTDSVLMSIIKAEFYLRGELVGSVTPTTDTNIKWSDLRGDNLHYFCKINVTKVRTPISGSSTFNYLKYMASMDTSYISNDTYNKYRGSKTFTIYYEYQPADADDWRTLPWEIGSLPSYSKQITEGGNEFLGSLLGISNYKALMLDNTSGKASYPLAIIVQVVDKL